MNAIALRFDEERLARDADRARTRRSMGWSAGLHAAILAWILLAAPSAAVHEPLTEITLVGPGEPESAGDPAPAAPARAPRTQTGVEEASRTEEHFRREARPAAVDPTPQSDAAAVDRLNARLAAIQSATSAPVASAASVGAPSSVWSSPAAATGPGGGGASPVALHRGGGAGSAPLALARGGTSTTFAAAGAIGRTPGESEASQPAAAPDVGAAARRTLAGASLAGPIADRAILHYVAPVYPDWAKHDGVEGAVTLYFVVRADGTVKENVLVQKTAGFGDFDDNARTALRDWRFESLHGGRTGEQWGTITFHYRLRGA
jgi:TonB family protein